ncbi:hypothetical protein ACFFRR_010605 [Megaselia abdita]
MGKCVSKHPSSLNLRRGSVLVTIPEDCSGDDEYGTAIIIRNILNNNDDDYHCYYYKEQDVDEDDDKENRCNCANIATTTAQHDDDDGTGYVNGKPSLPQYQMQYFPNGKENEITTAGYGSEIIIKNNSIIYNENDCNAATTTTTTTTTGISSSCGCGGFKNSADDGGNEGNDGPVEVDVKVEVDVDVDGNESRTGCKGSHLLSREYFSERIDFSKNNQELGARKGQSESKKSSKKSSTETKGTAMSFGFRKKISNITPKKKKKNGIEEEMVTESSKVIGNTSTGDLNDKNGNFGVPKESTSTSGAKANRFGFRAAYSVRPASTGITPKVADFSEVNENMENNNYNNSAKRRSKSAHSGRTMPSNTTNRYGNDQQNELKINKNLTYNTNEYQRQRQQQQQQQQNQPQIQHHQVGPPQYHSIVNKQNNQSANYTNPIVKPTPKPPSATYSKFTLQTASLPKLQYPVPISLNIQAPIDAKSAKQIANNNRKTFFGPREISADSGISMNSSSSGGSKNSANNKKPRNLQMVMSGRHKFEVRDIEDTTEELLNLPSLPSVFDTSTQPIPLCGLVRSNTVIERELLTPARPQTIPEGTINRPKLDEVFEEKLSLDCSTTEKHSKLSSSIKEFNNSSSSSRASWGNAGESMAAKDFSTISSSEDNKTYDDNSLQSISEFVSIESKPERPNNLTNINETKFAEMAAAACDFLLDDETSPTDSLVSTGSDDDEKHLKRRKNEEIQEKTLEDISPELECSSPLSPGTPTHASNSLSDMGRDFLIDDEIADQPALLFNDTAESSATPSIQNLVEQLSLGGSMRSLKSGSKARTALQAAIELNLKTPDSVKKAVFERTESLDTLSPCESIASDDLMVDFDCSSIDSYSVDRMSFSHRSQSGSALNLLDESTIMFPDISRTSDIRKEWNNVSRVHRTDKDSIISHLPARATRLLNRSRLQQQQLNNGGGIGVGSDSPKSNDSFATKRTISSRSSSINQHQNLQHSSRGDSSDDLMLYDKSFRNGMLQDILYFKKQVLKLRKILQEQDCESSKRSDTLNPFDDVNGDILNGLLESSALLDQTDDPQLELTDLQRQVVYLQGQITDRDRTIRLQKNQIEKLENDLEKFKTRTVSTSISEKEVVNSATQTERVRPPSIAQQELSRLRLGQE